jgi:hypothetical protein
MSPNVGGEVSTAEARSYYSAALAGLRLLEARRPTGRRFGADADARWSSFRGDLTTADRIDLLIRDADAQWPGAFGARNVFARRAVAEDEAFGVGWEPLDPIDAEELWRAEMTKPSAESVSAAARAVAERWSQRIAAVELTPIAATEKLVVAGPSAIVAVLEAFSKGQDLDWGDQVAVIATPPGHRQLAALGAALLNITTPTFLVTGSETASITGKRRVIASGDADEEDARRAHAFGGGA